MRGRRKQQIQHQGMHADTRRTNVGCQKIFQGGGLPSNSLFLFAVGGVASVSAEKSKSQETEKKQYKKYAAEQVLPGKQFAKHRVNFFGWLGEGYCFAIPPPTRTILYQIRGFNKANAFFVGEMGGGGIVFLPGPHKHLKKPKKSTNNKSG